MSKKQTLGAEKREILGKKVKRLRRDGILPGNIYGKNTKSLAVQVPVLEFSQTLSKVGETEVLDLQVLGEKKPRPVLIKQVQKNPVSKNLLHVDFMQVDLMEKVVVAVPLEFVGEPPAVKEGKGVLLELKNEVEVEALPTDLPSEIKVDLSGLKEINDALAVKDLKLPKKVKVQLDPHELICKIESQQLEKEAEKKSVQEEAVSTEEGEEKEEKEEEKKETAEEK